MNEGGKATGSHSSHSSQSQQREKQVFTPLHGNHFQIATSVRYQHYNLPIYYFLLAHTHELLFVAAPFRSLRNCIDSPWLTELL